MVFADDATMTGGDGNCATGADCCVPSRVSTTAIEESLSCRATRGDCCCSAAAAAVGGTMIVPLLCRGEGVVVACRERGGGGGGGWPVTADPIICRTIASEISGSAMFFFFEGTKGGEYVFKCEIVLNEENQKTDMKESFFFFFFLMVAGERV